MRKQRGFSVTEAVISVAILSIGITAFAKSQTYLANAQVHTQDQLMSLHLAGEINNLVEAHALTLTGLSPTEFSSQINAFSAQLQDRINPAQQRQNYRCQANAGHQEPTMATGVSDAPASVNTIEKGLQSGPIACVTIQNSTESTITGVPSVWVTTRISWVPRGIEGQDVQSIDAAKLVIGPAAYEGSTKYWY